MFFDGMANVVLRHNEQANLIKLKVSWGMRSQI